MSIEADSAETGRAGPAVVVAGELDSTTSPQLRGEILARLEAGCDLLVVDMAGVGFIDATGIGVLVGAANAARSAGGTLVLRAPSPAVEWLLDILGLDRTLGPTDARPERAGAPRSAPAALSLSLVARRRIHLRQGHLYRSPTGSPRRAGGGGATRPAASRPAADRPAAGFEPRYRSPGRK